MVYTCTCTRNTTKHIESRRMVVEQRDIIDADAIEMDGCDWATYV